MLSLNHFRKKGLSTQLLIANLFWKPIGERTGSHPLIPPDIVHILSDTLTNQTGKKRRG
jgi:hypothetical protein